MTETAINEDACAHLGCREPRVSGAEYCEDHLLEHEVAASHTTPTGGSLADLIRKAKGQGLIQPIASGYQHTA